MYDYINRKGLEDFYRTKTIVPVKIDLHERQRISN